MKLHISIVIYLTLLFSIIFVDQGYADLRKTRWKDWGSSPDYYYNERYYGINQKEESSDSYGKHQADSSEPGYYYNRRYFLSNQEKKSSSSAPQISHPESKFYQ